MKTIEDLFFGRNIPFESPALDPDEYRRLIDEILEFETPMLRSMNEEQKKLYNGYHSRRSALTIAEERDAFIRGFRLGVRIFLESLTDETQYPANFET